MKQQDEVFTQEELEKMNRDLQKNERAELPPALSRNAIEDAIKTVPQQTEPAAEQAPVSGKKRANRRALRAIAGLAAAAVAITTVGVMKPWARPPKPKVIPGDVRTAGDYSEIENLFAGYREQYVKSQKSGSSFGRLGSYFGVVEKTADMAVVELEVLQDATQFRTQPHRPHLLAGLSFFIRAVDLLEDEQPPCLLGIESCPLDHPHHRIFTAVTIHIARLKLIHRICQPPAVGFISACYNQPI